MFLHIIPSQNGSGTHQFIEINWKLWILFIQMQRKEILMKSSILLLYMITHINIYLIGMGRKNLVIFLLQIKNNCSTLSSNQIQEWNFVKKTGSIREKMM